jgi:transposase-like protein
VPRQKRALAALRPTDAPVQHCTVHKHRNLLAYAPERLQEEISNDYRDMIYAAIRAEIEARRKAFIRKWRLKCRGWRQAVHLHPLPAEPMEVDPHLERDRAPA